MPPVVSIPLAVVFFAVFLSDFWAACAGGWSRIGSRLRLLRHAPLRDPPFLDETQRLALVEKVSSPPPFPGRSRRLRR